MIIPLRQRVGRTIVTSSLSNGSGGRVPHAQPAAATITPSSQMDAGGRLSAPLAGAVTVYVGWHGPRLPEVN